MRTAQARRRSIKVPKKVAAPHLTSREEEVLRLLKLGQSYKEIGTALNIADRTVKFHVSNILLKFGVSNRLELLSFCVVLAKTTSMPGASDSLITCPGGQLLLVRRVD